MWAHGFAVIWAMCSSQDMPAPWSVTIRLGSRFSDLGFASALAGRTACLLANHGMIVHAQTADRALTAAVVLETLCRQYLLARAAGAVRLLTGDEMRAAHERFRTYGQRSAPR